MNSIHPSFSSARLLCGALLSLLPLTASAQRTINFDDLTLAPDSFHNGSDEAGDWSSGGATFANDYNTDWGSWSGWSYSNVSDNTTAGWGNQYAAITGAGLGSNDIYAVAFDQGARIFLPENENIQSLQVTNSAYAYFAMRDGDSFSKQFASADDDFFKITITGLNALESPVGSVDFFLADFRHDDSALDYIVNEWASVDLTTFGADVRSLEFAFASSDNGTFGMNTPAYFALGEVTVIPEPTTYALWGGLAAGLAILVRRRTTTGSGLRPL